MFIFIYQYADRSGKCEIVEMSIKLEILAMLIIFIIFLFHYDVSSQYQLRYNLFTVNLILAEAAIALDSVSVYIMSCDAAIPLWVHIVVNTLYFLVTDLSFSVIVAYSFYLLFEHVSDHHCLKIAISLISGFFCFLFGTVLVNLWTGCLFYFENGVYQRGPLNRVGYYVLLIELCMFCVCYLRNKDIVSSAMRRLMTIVPPLVLLLVIVQMYVPDLLLNGTMMALILLIYFVNFQSMRTFQDSLTELQNRSAFYHELQVQQKRHKSVDLIMIQLEHFETVNRRFGMKKGDNILFSVSKYLERVSSSYRAFRFGNTRFILMKVYKGKGGEDVKTTAERLQLRFAQPWKEKDTEFLIEATVGYMTTDQKETDAGKIIDQMEYAVEYTRDSAQKGVASFDQSLQQKYERRDYVLTQIQRALEEDTFVVYYQPLFDCGSRRFTTAESLLRLFDENGQMISPAEFIPLAEQQGLLDRISWMVLRKVCRFLSEHQDLGISQISINLSVQQLEDVRFLERVQNILAEYHVSPEQIRIEITERVMMDNPRLIQSVMMLAENAGVKFYLDDFGVGYSNLASMMSLPFETVKLDSSLIQEVENNLQKRATVDLLIQMLHNAGFLVVAEGVETQEQAEQIAALGVDRIQGFYYARPINSRNYEEFLMEKRSE